MKAIPLVLLFSISLTAQQLEPVSAIDFGPALKVTGHHPHLPIMFLAATHDGPIAAGGSATYDLGIARAAPDGSGIQAIRLRVPYGGGGNIAARPDGAIWFTTRWSHPFLHEEPVLGGEGGAWPHGSKPTGPPVIVGDPTAGASAPFNTREYPTNYDLYAADGRRLESFQSLNFGTDIAASTNEVAIVAANLIRVGHVSNGKFVTDRDWHVNGPHLVFPLDQDRFAVVNRMSGEFAIIDPSTPATQTIAVPLKSPSIRDRLPVTAVDGGIWFLVPGVQGNTRDLVQFGLDGSLVSRYTLRLAPGVKPLRIAISSRDVYLAGTTATVYRYELPPVQ